MVSLIACVTNNAAALYIEIMPVVFLREREREASASSTVKVNCLTCRSVGLVKVENALVSGELTEAANGEHEMEVLLV